jgi:hypothetical protein
MKAKKSASRKKLSFAVDREEIEINSDWVSAVMAPQAQRTEAPVFFDGKANNTTVEENSTGEQIAPGEMDTPVVVNAPVDQDAPVSNTATVVATEPAPQGPQQDAATDENTTTVAYNALRGRPRPIRRITDGLTPGQYAVYSLMYENGASGADSGARIYRGGYADLGALTGLSKRGIQNVVAELQRKRVISLEQAPGHHRSQTSVYRVPAAAIVLETWFGEGWRYALGKSKVLISATVAVSATHWV